MIKTGSLFKQVLSLVDRNDFSRTVRQWEAKKGAKGFCCWDQFVSMVFCQLAGADSLREICGGLSMTMGKLHYCPIKTSVRRKAESVEAIGLSRYSLQASIKPAATNPPALAGGSSIYNAGQNYVVA